MNLLASAPVYFAFGLWAVLCFAIVARWRNARAVSACLLGAWLFLPNGTIRFPYFFYTTKMLAVTLVLLGVVLLLDFRRVKNFRVQWMDVPMGLFCTVPFFSALVNGFAPAEALQLTFEHACTFSIPYFLGRVYLDAWNARRDFVIGIVLGGCVYVPLCWYEIFFGPFLHTTLYGFAPSALEMAVRFGGWRPLVFQLHGLMVGLFMASATVCAFWLYHTRTVPRIWKIPMLWIFLGLAITTVGVKSVNGWALAILGILFLWGSTRLPMWNVLRAYCVTITAYLAARLTGVWGARELATAASFLDGKETSLYYRVVFESLIAERARSHWFLGWGSHARAMVRSYMGHMETVSDSFWIAVYGMWGIVGLGLWLAIFFAPLLNFVKKFPATTWRRAEIAPAAALLTLGLMYQFDALLNTMHSPIYLFALGGIACIHRKNSVTQT